MAQAAEVHDWIENFVDLDFEGVWICKNTLGKWDEGAALRAFQTFQWRDATTEGNDSSFAHIVTGVVVRFDGAALAIEFGHGQLQEALPDLIDVLYSLGWRVVELYHPGPTAATNEFLGDIGRAIPARYHDFDIHIAEVKVAISEFAEGAAMVARGKQLLGGAVAEVEEATLFGEMQALNMRAMGGREVALSDHVERPGAAVGQMGGIVLDDGDEAEDDEVLVVGGRSVPAVVVSAPAAPKQAAPVVQAVDFDDYDEAPRLYELPGAGSDAAVVPIALELESEPLDFDMVEQAAPQLRVQQIPQPEVQQPAFQAELMDRVTDSVVPALPVLGVEAAKPAVRPNSSFALTEKTMPVLPAKSHVVFDVEMADSVIAVGRSAFVFDLPANPMTDDDVRAVADEYGVGSKDVVHIHPGALGEVVRWDVLGEVAPAFPFFVEKLVDVMFAGQGNGPLIASMVLSLKQGNPRAQLRDLLVLVGWLPMEIVEDIRKVSPAVAASLAGRSDADGDLVQSMAVVSRRLGALGLAPAGQVFVDLVSEVDSADDSGDDHSFTVMSILQSPSSRLYVVHVDQLDGPFVLWIVNLLRFVANSYAATKRYSCAVEGVADVGGSDAVAPSDKNVIAAMAGELQTMLDKFRALGFI